MNYNNLCYQCFCEKPIRERPCPECGYSYNPAQLSPNVLRPGTLLYNRYIVGLALGIGGFGITYKCLDTKIGGICAVKEYFPANYAMRQGATKTVSVAEQNIDRYNKIMRRFVEEADLVKSLSHRNIVTIYDSFFENNTAYYVMEYCDGIDLRRYSNNFSRKLSYDEGMNILYQVMNGLEYIHGKGVLHRDIAPDNIYVTKNNMVKILDFGSARREMDQMNRELSVIIKVGYAPVEQYGGGRKQGPYTDIYALGATFYHLFTGRTPIESTQRVAEDRLEPFSRLRPDLPDNLKYCIEKAMELPVSQRIQSIGEMKSILGIKENAKQAVYQPPKPPKPPTPIKPQPVKPQPVKPVKPVKQPPSKVYQPSGYVRAGISMRLGAYLIDLVLWSLVYYSILFGTLGVGDRAYGLSFLFPVLFTIINIISELISQTTVGKALLHMQVRGGQNGEVMPSQILLRNIIKLLTVFVVIFANGDELLQDRATGSMVCVKK